MPVNAIAPSEPPASSTTVPPPAATGRSDADFAAVLNGALRTPMAAPTVTLSAMVDALAGRAMDPSQVRPDLGPPVASAAARTVAPEASGGSPGATGAGAALLAAAERYLGVPYLWGGTDPAKGLDCSGFVQRAFSDRGVSLPRVSIDQSKQGVAVPGGLADAQPGDLLFWGGSGSGPNHIAIYAGDGRMIEAPSAGDVVRYSPVTRTPHAVRRVL